ncbi:GTP-binding protein [Cytobacillus sp. FJAT-53684]|uniref:GTP-binding protein n=1 Tax=Cytobacillus mangrovibacter TaxID=3299024 RepID=A0ABW6JZ87_9BACI
MTIDKQLISKRYYKTLTESGGSLHPIKLLGDLYMEEQKAEMADLSYIRFSQGEVYFHNRDYEAAIFKWENISNELEPWAKKNMADAYFELELLSTAEDIYQSIHTDSEVLKIEVLLQLFTLYVERGKLELAVKAIKDAVSLNPDYSNVTEIARLFFEEYQDWSHAVELAVKESVRTGEPQWFDILHAYVEQGRTKKMEPNDFGEVLHSLYKIDLVRFEGLTVSLWNSYKNSERYFPWLKEINHILLHKERSSAHSWHELSDLYQDTYDELINGKYLIREISYLMPNHLTNWIKIANPSHAIVASASTLAWSELFTSGIEPDTINRAERLLKQSTRNIDGLENGYGLFESIINWAMKNGMELGQRFGWMVKELLDLNAHHLLLAGIDGQGKEAFTRSIMDGKLAQERLSMAVMYKDNDVTEILEVSDEVIRKITDLTELQNQSQTLVQWKAPDPFLRTNGIALIDTPSMTSDNRFRNEVFQYLQFADSLLFILDAKELFSEKELEMIVKIREQAPELPIHFLLNSVEQEIIDLVSTRVHTYFPKIRIFAFSMNDRELAGLVNFIADMRNNRNLKEERLTKVHHTIRKTIKYLLERRVEMENSFIDSIKWNEDMVTKLTGAINQLSDLEEEKVRMIRRTFRKMTDEIRQELLGEVPKILQKCSELITEDSDLGKIHIKLNDEMNKRIHYYIEETLLPAFHQAFLNWIEEANREFEQSQLFLNEMCEGFNDLYGDEKIKLDCDFKLLGDWLRDADRLTRGSVQIEKENILLRFTPSQFLLKSAGRIFSSIPQNKGIIHNKYRQFIENEDYSHVSISISNQLFQPFELFERALDRDIQLFFKSPFTILNETVAEASEEIETNKESLHEMRVNPEAYRDPLTLFQLKLRQHEWMANAGEEISQYQG